MQWVMFKPEQKVKASVPYSLPYAIIRKKKIYIYIYIYNRGDYISVSLQSECERH
jgi:hypothetical protein